MYLGIFQRNSEMKREPTAKTEPTKRATNVPLTLLTSKAFLTFSKKTSTLETRDVQRKKYELKTVENLRQKRDMDCDEVGAPERIRLNFSINPNDYNITWTAECVCVYRDTKMDRFSEKFQTIFEASPLL